MPRPVGVGVSFQRRTEAVPCPSCGALAGRPCRTKGGELAEVSHAGRVTLYRRAEGEQLELEAVP